MILAMSFGLEIILALISAIFSVVLAAVVSVFVWYFRKYVLSEIERNSEFRRYAGGVDAYENDGGKLETLAELSEEMRDQHQDANRRLDFLVAYVRSMGDAIRQSGIEFEEPDPEDPLNRKGDFYRGGDAEEPEAVPDGGDPLDG